MSKRTRGAHEAAQQKQQLSASGTDDGKHPNSSRTKRRTDGDASSRPPEADGVKYLRAKVTSPLAGHESACVDITENFHPKTGKCDATAVLKKINQACMWMVPAYEVDRHRQLYEKAVREALEDLRKIDNGVRAEVHDGLVERFDSLQRPNQRHDSLVYEDATQTDGPGALPVQTVQWGDAEDDVQKASRRSWMMTEQGKQHLRAHPHSSALHWLRQQPALRSYSRCVGAGEGRFAFYASVHKENARKKQHPDHKEFHRLCLHATYRSPANSEQLLGELADHVEEQVAGRLGIKKRSSVRGSGDPYGEPLLCFQFNSGQGAYVLHGDDPGDPYPQDDSFIAGGGGFGSTVANVTLRKGATIVFEIYNPRTDAGGWQPLSLSLSLSLSVSVSV